MSRYCFGILAASGLLCLPLAAVGQSITGVSSINNSSEDPPSENREFHTEIDLSAVEEGVLRSSFVHRIAFRNTHVALGGLAQTNKRVVAFDLAFTVEDSDENGFLLRVDEFAQGISGILWGDGGTGGTALATGISMLAEYDDSTDGADTFAPIGSLVGLGPNGVQITEPGSIAELQERANKADLGPYVGTTTFVLRFSSFFSPTTNVVFPNDVTGSGAVLYGFGAVPPGFDGVSADDLGHFLRITASFASPCPGDVTGDEVVDLEDLNLVLANFGTDSLEGDATLDGAVGLDDLNAVLAAFGAPCE
jgi:hypothetical protein